MKIFEQHYQVQWEEFRVDVYRSFSAQLSWIEIVGEAFEAFQGLAQDFCALQEFEDKVTVSIITHSRKAIESEIDYFTLEREA
ncbi:hypothetical protein EVJ32_10770 [Exiguobacterium sp. SH5S4]|uniref:hypothetical protein n=1 Tax=Exiguobacterium sp. SH5S4 TaxID=2510961 RepID=UPI00104011FC|nr:hypothetical protein [Exiguobacterium sp. SH5S4]TCI25275.1 hypothetical protein EVJ32_10770 [Exiguobacterium sp. SH5S4]